jgi:magnesium-transporting ATPase (P-type)
VSINATVRRQTGAEAHDHIDLPIEQLVPGDIVLLSAGDMIPADLRLITAKDLFLNQSTLTGEAMPLEKVAAAHAGAAETPFDLPNICFMGSAYWQQRFSLDLTKDGTPTPRCTRKRNEGRPAADGAEPPVAQEGHGALREQGRRST